MKIQDVMIKDIGTVVTGSTPKTQKKEYYNSNDYMFVGPTDIKNSKYVTKTEKHISKLAFDNYKTRFIKKNSIMIDCIGSDMGNVSISTDLVLTNQQINSITDIEQEKYNIDYLYYVLSTMKKYFHLIGTNGSTMPILNKKMFEEIKIPVVDKLIQDKIAKMLSILDNKIIENNATNNNLYELSKTVYKDWYEKLDKSKKSIFCEFKELGTPVMGQSPKGESYNYENNGYPLINGAADYKNGYLSPQKYTSMPTKICHNGDYIFCIRATIGLLVESDRDYCLGRGVAGITSINPLYKEYVYHLIESSIDKFKNMATGSVIVGISKDDIRNMEVVVPSNEEIKQFHIVQKELFSKMKNIREETETLIKLRDTLLPKLMNGEIDLENIEI